LGNRNCNLPEDELVKMKKKAKGSALSDLNGLVAKAWLPLAEFRGTNSREFVKRIEIIPLDGTDDPNVDPTVYNWEKTYIKLRIRVSPTLVPEIREAQNRIMDVLPRQIPPKKVSLADR
jgi:hypothetical protein